MGYSPNFLGMPCFLPQTGLCSITVIWVSCESNRVYSSVGHWKWRDVAFFWESPGILKKEKKCVSGNRCFFLPALHLKADGDARDAIEDGEDPKVYHDEDQSTESRVEDE